MFLQRHRFDLQLKMVSMCQPKKMTGLENLDVELMKQVRVNLGFRIRDAFGT